MLSPRVAGAGGYPGNHPLPATGTRPMAWPGRAFAPVIPRHSRRRRPSGADRRASRDTVPLNVTGARAGVSV